MPTEFHVYLKYCREMKFEEKPDIAYLRKLFKDLFYTKGYDYDFVFDWMVKKPAIEQMPAVGNKTEQDNAFYQNKEAQPTEEKDE